MLKIYTEKSKKLSNVDLVGVKNSALCLFDYDLLGKISYKNELSGSENKLPEFASFSKRNKKVVIAGAITDNYGVLKKSIVIADNGKLLGISDMTICIDGSAFTGGGCFKVYKTSVCKIGLIVDDDIINTDGVKALSLCDVDVIVAIISGEEKPQHNFLIRAYAYLFGLPFILLSQTGIIASDMHGEICGKSVEQKSNLIIPTKKQYMLIKSKRRGVKE